jgi:glycosyltransferase involved in cell wall biosynthesis
MTGQPALSVVVPSVNNDPVLFECLDALGREDAADAPVEIVVVDRCGDDRRRTIGERHPSAIVLAAGAGTSIPAMRAAAFARARADAVAVIEDHVIVPSGWARQMRNALASGAGAAGGTVRNAATETVADWAAFLCEYSHLLVPRPAGDTDWLTGNNVVYRRVLLERYADALAEGRWEDHLHDVMRRDGVRLVYRPDIIVWHKMHYRVRGYAGQRYLYSRMYAGHRASDLTVAGRALRAALSAALPPVLLTRIVRRTLAAGGYGGVLIRSLPLLPVFVCAWAAGEVVGYAAGPGDAPGRVK